jgi:hypothetical protein
LEFKKEPSMTKSISLSLILVLVFLLSACTGTPTAAPAASPTSPLPTLPPLVTSTPVQLPTVVSPTAAATRTVQPATVLPDISSSNYLDDRSTPAALMLSYFNAINRQEYLRAYSYSAEVSDLGSLEQFSQGYSDTKSVSVSFGGITTEGAAGSIYYSVPMILSSTQTNGTLQKFAACYVLRLSQPGNYGAPPINPMHIEQRGAQAISTGTSEADALSTICQSLNMPVGANTAVAEVEKLDDLSSANYIDNRSDPVTVIKSLLNAINSQQYVRAYSYFQETPSTYAVFAAQYANTASVDAQFGTFTPDAGAGQIYFTVPAVVKTTLNDGTLQTASVCYTLHLSQPGIQGMPPFQPLGIKSITSKLAAAGADSAALLASACQ